MMSSSNDFRSCQQTPDVFNSDEEEEEGRFKVAQSSSERRQSQLPLCSCERAPKAATEENSFARAEVSIPTTSSRLNAESPKLCVF